ncbi:MAG: S8/S53 family peptidase [Caldilineaceae bacterium]|nr:S8/S53 family peptidase [Caldilineaceae bacterium]
MSKYMIIVVGPLLLLLLFLVACQAPATLAPAALASSEPPVGPLCIFDPDGGGFTSEGGCTGLNCQPRSHGSLVWSVLTETLRTAQATYHDTQTEPVDPVVLLVVDQFTPTVPADELWEIEEGYILLKAVDLIDFDNTAQMAETARRIVAAINQVNGSALFSTGLQHLVINMSWIIRPCDPPASPPPAPVAAPALPITRQEERSAICAAISNASGQEFAATAADLRIPLCDPNNPNWFTVDVLDQFTALYQESPDFKATLDTFVNSNEFKVTVQRNNAYNGNQQLLAFDKLAPVELFDQPILDNPFLNNVLQAFAINNELSRTPEFVQTFGPLAQLLTACFYPSFGATEGIAINCPAEWQSLSHLKVINVAASGNNAVGRNQGYPYWPGRFPSVVSVTDNRKEHLAIYSPNAGEIGMDGSHPLYADFMGTSFAAPRFSLLAAKYFLMGGEVPCADDPLAGAHMPIYPPLGFMPEIAFGQEDMWENPAYHKNLSVQQAAAYYCQSFPTQ